MLTFQESINAVLNGETSLPKTHVRNEQGNGVDIRKGQNLNPRHKKRALQCSAIKYELTTPDFRGSHYHRSDDQ